MAQLVFISAAVPSTPSGPPTDSNRWIRAHEELSRLAKRRAQLEWEEGRGLLAALRAKVHQHLGFGSFVEYVETLFGYKPRSIEEKLRVAEALEALPVLGNDLREGNLNWSAVRELTRVATAGTESAWREAVRGKSVRQIELLVAGRKPGDTPHSRPDSALRRHVLAFEVHAETLATFREALSKLRHDSGEPLDEETALLLMARQVLGGPTDSGRASYQIAFTLCEECGRGFQHGRGEQLEVERHVTQMATCDAQYIGHVASSTAENVRPTVSAHVGGTARETADRDSPEPANRATHEAAERSSHQSTARVSPRTADETVSNITRRRTRPLPSRASQDIPPAVRRLVLHRDHDQCVVPGCRHATFVDVHHLKLRAEGGSHAPDSLVVLCAAHHRAVHRGLLVLEGNTAQSLIFRHADGSPYRDLISPHFAAAQTQAFAALRKLGFREGEVHRALARLRTEVAPDQASSTQLVRAALQLLTTAPVAHPC